MDNVKNIIALDCGNSSFRLVLGQYDGKHIKTEIIMQIPNDMVRVFDYYYWDFLKIFSYFKQGLKKVVERGYKIDSIGVCTWGIDFALYDKRGNMLNNPLSYRNTIGNQYLERLNLGQKKDLFFDTGILCDKINSLYMLNGMRDHFPEIFSTADKILMIPDIINYMLTGKMVNEPSELSTTQILNSQTRKISKKICEQFSIPTSMFNPIGKHGLAIGNILPYIKEEIGVDYDIPVICVPSHDTASAVMAVPTEDERFVFISSGTWSLIGTELDEPIINEKVLESGLTNEVGAFNKITMLKNSTGMFIIQRIKKEFDEVMGAEHTWDELDEIAKQYTGNAPLFNVNSDCFFNTRHMGKEIWNYLIKTGQVSGEINWGAVIKSVHESMACSYAQTIQDIENITGENFSSIYIVGGGSKNVMVNELTAKRTGKKVIACSKESTSLGNIAAQLKYFVPDITVKGIRKILRDSVAVREYVTDFEDNSMVETYSKLPLNFERDVENE